MVYAFLLGGLTTSVLIIVILYVIMGKDDEE